MYAVCAGAVKAADAGIAVVPLGPVEEGSRSDASGKKGGLPYLRCLLLSSAADYGVPDGPSVGTRMSVPAFGSSVSPSLLASLRSCALTR